MLCAIRSSLTATLSSGWIGALQASRILRAASTIAFQEVAPDPSVRKTLAHDSTPKTLMVVHGLLGSGRNWRSFIRRVVNSAAEKHGSHWQAVLVDLRNHGSSTSVPGLHPPHNMESTAGDLIELVNTQLGGKMPDKILGHSLGGKVLLELLQQVKSSNGDIPSPEEVWILDSQPGSISSPHNSAMDSVVTVLTTIKDIPLPMPSRSWLYAYCKDKGISEATAMWLGSNMVPMGGNTDAERFTWAFHIQGATAMYMSYRTKSYWEVLSRPPEDTNIHVVRAEQSDRWNTQMWEQLLACEQSSKQAALTSGGCTTVHRLADAGHWLHVDNPSGLLDLLLPYFEPNTSKSSL